MANNGGWGSDSDDDLGYNPNTNVSGNSLNPTGLSPSGLPNPNSKSHPPNGSYPNLPSGNNTYQSYVSNTTYGGKPAGHYTGNTTQNNQPPQSTGFDFLGSMTSGNKQGNYSSSSRELSDSSESSPIPAPKPAPIGKSKPALSGDKKGSKSQKQQYEPYINVPKYDQNTDWGSCPLPPQTTKQATGTPKTLKHTKKTKGPEKPNGVKPNGNTKAPPPPQRPRVQIQRYPLTLWEYLKYTFVADPDVKWGPFYDLTRAARREQNFREWTMSEMWDGIPESVKNPPPLQIQMFAPSTETQSTTNQAKESQAKESEKKATQKKGKKKTGEKKHKKKSQKNGGTDGKLLGGADDGDNLLTDGDNSKPPPNPALLTPPPDLPPQPYEPTTAIQGDFSPAQVDFREWFRIRQHPKDYDDEFYTKTYRLLYQRLCEFGERWFGGGVHLNNTNPAPTGSPWRAPHMEQFIQYARLVAHEDRDHWFWPDLLNDSVQRKWLCVSIISQIIEKKIFNQLLFGGTEFHTKELDRQDTSFCEREGYGRKEGRANVVRAACEGRLVPSEFWPAVDDLAAQTVMIFRPLLMLQKLHRPNDSWYIQPVFWQELHTLLAFAGYFQITMAISDSVFHVLSATPGARMDYGIEEQADMPLYRESKEWHEHRDRIYKQMLNSRIKTGSNKPPAPEMTPENIEIFAQYPPVPQVASPPSEENQRAYRQIEYHLIRGAKIKFAVFPMLTRYKAENQGSHPSADQIYLMNDDYEKYEGQRIAELSRCIVVYYQGLIYPAPGTTDGVPLEAHLNELSLASGLARYLPRWYWQWNPDGSYTWWLTRGDLNWKRFLYFPAFVIYLSGVSVALTYDSIRWLWAWSTGTTDVESQEDSFAFSSWIIAYFFSFVKAMVQWPMVFLSSIIVAVYNWAFWSWFDGTWWLGFWRSDFGLHLITAVISGALFWYTFIHRKRIEL